MPVTPGLNPNLRQVYPAPDPLPPALEVAITDDEGGVVPATNPGKGGVIKVEHGDGSVTISLDGSSLAPGSGNREGPAGWFDNLVEDLDEQELNRISEDLLRGIADDITSRAEWLEDRAAGIRLLGLKIEVPGTSSSGEGAAVEGQSRVRHPLLLEACLRFQANARSELLPTDGPVKIRNDDNNADSGEDQLANALETDLNHYLTVTATEYYPDTDRMLLMLGFGGTAFKKVYYCALRNRPVSESVDAAEIIVNNSATDLKNAKRVTHRIMMKPSTVRRLQILGVYRDTELPTPNQAEMDSAQKEKKAQEGVSSDAMRPEDRDREIYECHCELDVVGFEHTFKGKASGLEVPYRVTIDLSSRKVLAIVRNYDEETKEMPEARTTFVKYSFVPGMGFYDIGLLQILGNTTNAVTAAWRELLDTGMFANFPGFLMADSGARQNTNIFRVPPGGGALVKTGGMPIQQAIMPLPYQTTGMPALMSLVENMVETGQRVGGTAELAVGEGRQDAPVGTTIAMIEQAQKVLNAVHKRMHSAQSEEFQLLARCFNENPESFWQRNRRPAYQWDEDTFLKALANFQLVPQADPNTSSQTQRIMKVMALKQLQAAQPGMYDPVAVENAALRAIGWSNPQEFLAPPEAQGKPTPEMQEKIAKAQVDKQRADADTMRAQTDAKRLEADTTLKAKGLQVDEQDKQQKNEIDAAKAVANKSSTEMDDISKAEQRLSEERIQLIDIGQNLVVHPESAPLVTPLIQPALQNVSERQNEIESRKRAQNAGVIPPGVGGGEPPAGGGGVLG